MTLLSLPWRARKKLSATAASAEDLSLLVFPVDRRYWQEPAAARRRFQSAAISRKGLVNVLGLPAGEYFLVVVPEPATIAMVGITALGLIARRRRR